MSGHDIIVIGASAGGVEALSKLVKLLPSDLPASLFVVMHFPSFGFSLLPKILSRAGQLPALHPTSGDIISKGIIYVAPPNHHLLVHQNQVELSVGPRENGHRPAVDTLFRSAAYSYRRRVVGVVLSGMLDDGTVGLAMIRLRGGVTIAQDPNEALFPGMPRSAIEQVSVDYILPIDALAACLIELTHTPVAEEPAMLKDDRDDEVVAKDKAALERGERSGMPSPLTCPECGGVLWELSNSNLLRFRCHTGHAYSIDSLMAAQADDVESALWSAVRVLEEKASLARRMANHAEAANRPISASQFLERATEAEQHANLLRQVIEQQTQTEQRDG